MRRVRGHKSRHRELSELNITAFMNLMVVLVPFLLITAVFSRLAVLDVNLPKSQSQQSSSPHKPELALEVTVRDSGIEVGDRNAGLLSRISKTHGAYDFAKLASYLQRVKQQFPDKVDATLLLEPDIPYQDIVKVMDTLRVAEIVDSRTNQIVEQQLFPEISIGDAPEAGGRRSK